MASDAARLAGATPSYIPRPDDEEAVRTLLRENLSVTVTGAAGSGKTRLAAEVGSSLAERFKDGVHAIDLAPLAESDEVGPHVLVALGLNEEAGRDPVTVAVEACRERRILFVLDNCEHVLAGAAAFTNAMVTRGIGPAVLATSREPLGVKGERVHALDPMDVPAEDGPSDPASLLRFDSVRLFVERARAVKATYELTADDAPAVARICRALDGIPLAIELAAGRIGVLRPAQIADKLADRFRLLASRDPSARHRTLREAIDWSYEPLDDRDRTVFERLSVFAGPFAFEQASAVCADEAIDDFEVTDAIDVLASRSLVSARDGAHGTVLRLLESVREYAAERLEARGGTAEARRRHVDLFAGIALEARAAFGGPGEAEAIGRLNEAMADLRAAMRADPARALEIALALAPYFERTRPAEGARLLEAALEHPSDPMLEARALRAAAGLALRRGDAVAAREMATASLGRYRAAGDEAGAADALINVGVAAGLLGDAAGMEAALEESLRTARASGNRATETSALTNLGWAAVRTGDRAGARDRFEQALTLARESGDRSMEARVMANLGHLAEADEARRLLRESLAIRRELGDRAGALESMRSLGRMLAADGDAGARSLLEECLRLARELQSRAIEVEALLRLSDIARGEGRLDDAEGLGRAALDVAERTGVANLVSAAHEELADTYAAQGRGDDATRSLEAAAEAAEASGDGAAAEQIRARIAT